MTPSRRAVVRAALADHQVAALVVTGLPNVRWLTGFTGSAGRVLLRTDGGPDLLITDARYAERAAEEAPDLGLVLDRGWGWLADALPAGAPIGVEAERLTVAAFEDAADVVGRARLRPLRGVVEERRVVKDDSEIAVLRRACEITVAAFERLCAWLAPGLTERDVARRLEDDLRAAGADGIAFPTIVASGPHGARPHHEPGVRTLRRGDLVTCDFGARVAGYHADMTRTVALGKPSAALRAVYDLVEQAQDAGVRAVAPGVSAEAVDAACRDVIAAAGHGEEFPHPTGHGVGLEIHERPILRAGAAGTLRPRTTVTVEPGVYISGLGGVRIEDVVTVTDAGAERLTTAPRSLIRL